MPAKNMYYSFEDMNPDAGWFGSSGVGILNNFSPSKYGYSPGPYLEYFKTPSRTAGKLPMDGEVLGVLPLQYGINTSSLYVHVAQSGGTLGYTIRRYRIDDITNDFPVGGDLTPASGWSQGSGNDEIIETWGVQFTRYGADAYCTDGISGLFRSQNSSIAYTLISGGSGSADPIPKTIASFGGHLVIANVNIASPYGGIGSGENPSLVWWSAFDDPQTFGSVLVTPQHKGTDYKFLYDTPGGVIKLVPAGDVIYAFKERSIYLGEGPPFRWNLLSNSVGTQFPNSTGYHGGKVYFMSDSGPAAVGKDGQIQYFLDGKARRTLIGTSSSFAT